MDSGIFLSNRKNMLLWVLTPLLISAVFYLFLFSYFKNRESLFLEKRSFIESIPLINQKISAAEVLLKKYNFTMSKSESIEKLNSQLREAARLANISIDSLNIDANPQGSSDRSIFKVAVKTAGSLGSIAGFIEAIQASGMLLTLDSAKIRLYGIGEAQDYSADIVFSYHSLQ